MITAVAADEPPEPQPSFATGGIVTGPNTVLMTDGCVWPVGGGTTAGPSGNVSVTFDPAAMRRIAERLEADARRLMPRLHVYEWSNAGDDDREPYFTTAYVGEPVREIEERP